MSESARVSGLNLKLCFLGLHEQYSHEQYSVCFTFCPGNANIQPGLNWHWRVTCFEWVTTWNSYNLFARCFIYKLIRKKIALHLCYLFLLDGMGPRFMVQSLEELCIAEGFWLFCERKAAEEMYAAACSVTHIWVTRPQPHLPPVCNCNNRYL